MTVQTTRASGCAVQTPGRRLRTPRDGLVKAWREEQHRHDASRAETGRPPSDQARRAHPCDPNYRALAISGRAWAQGATDARGGGDAFDPGRRTGPPVPVTDRRPPGDEHRREARRRPGPGASVPLARKLGVSDHGNNALLAATPATPRRAGLRGARGQVPQSAHRPRPSSARRSPQGSRGQRRGSVEQHEPRAQIVTRWASGARTS